MRHLVALFCWPWATMSLGFEERETCGPRGERALPPGPSEGGRWSPEPCPQVRHSSAQWPWEGAPSGAGVPCRAPGDSGDQHGTWRPGKVNPEAACAGRPQAPHLLPLLGALWRVHRNRNTQLMSVRESQRQGSRQTEAPHEGVLSVVRGAVTSPVRANDTTWSGEGAGGGACSAAGPARPAPEQPQPRPDTPALEVRDGEGAVTHSGPWDITPARASTSQ